ncbi:MAG: hypothetical protein IKB98_06540 [Clostridia bacterium]|nr:hypothetical protein [Clostridia bacterium]
MAETKKELVDLYIPRTSNSTDPNFFIGINGKNYILPRGKTSKVPKEVADEYNRAVRAQNRYAETEDKLKGLASKGV